MKVKCYVRYRKSELVCLCKKDNPGCDKGQCGEETATIDRFKGVEEVFKNKESKR